MQRYKDWIQKERNGFWVNEKTKQETLFHPQAIEIGEHVWKAYKRFRPKLKGVRKVKS